MYNCVKPHRIDNALPIFSLKRYIFKSIFRAALSIVNIIKRASQHFDILILLKLKKKLRLYRILY